MQTDRPQTDRQTDRQTERQTNVQTTNRQTLLSKLKLDKVYSSPTKYYSNRLFSMIDIFNKNCIFYIRDIPSKSYYQKEIILSIIG